MFALTIEHLDTTAVTTHPSREAAHAPLLKILDETGRDYRVTPASWTHTGYEILGPCGSGRAAIDELCACTHTGNQHEDAICTSYSFSAGRLVECGCTGYRPMCDDPTLFDTDPPAIASTTGPPAMEPT